MAYTLEQIAALEEAIASGHRAVKYADKEVVYKDTDEMIAVLNMMKNSLNPYPRGSRRYGAYAKNSCD
jgi:hypothetical protein